MFDAKIAAGMNESNARSAVARAIKKSVAAGRSPMADGSMPSEVSIRRWLKINETLL
jgi:hypothetical protein